MNQQAPKPLPPEAVAALAHVYFIQRTGLQMAETLRRFYPQMDALERCESAAIAAGVLAHDVAPEQTPVDATAWPARLVTIGFHVGEVAAGG